MMVSHQFNADRLRHVEQQLKLSYDEDHELKREIRFATDPNQRIALRLRLKNEVIPSLQRLEIEYATALADSVDAGKLPENEAKTLLGELVPAVKRFEGELSADAGDDIRTRLEEIHASLAKPGRSAGAKLKVLLPIIPFLCVYELELDTENTLNAIFGKVKNLFRSQVQCKCSPGLA